MELGGTLGGFELVNPAPKECLGLCRRHEAVRQPELWAPLGRGRGKGPRAAPGPVVKAFDSDKAQPSSPVEAGQDQIRNQRYPLRPIFV